MSRNLCTSSCCENVVRLPDLRGKPIEFRQYANDPPKIGTRWDCPSCGKAYFAIWRDAEWSYQSNNWIRGFVIDLSYYESFNDEHSDSPLDNPEHLCLDDAEHFQEVW